MRKKAPILLSAMMAFWPLMARADLIDFESGFVDQQAVGTMVTATNEVTFSTSGGSAFLAQVGGLTTAFASQDTPQDQTISGQFFLTDESDGPAAAYDYFLRFTFPVLDLSLSLYDYRGDSGGGGPGATATLSAFADYAMTMLVGTDLFIVPSPPPGKGNTANLAVTNPSTSILAAALTFSHQQPGKSGHDMGTGIDNIRFDTASGPIPQPVPEPGTLILLGSGLAGLRFVGRRKKPSY
jgi:hypothetical protein